MRIIGNDWNPVIANMRALLGDEIFGATFVKADGSIRTGTFRLGVQKDQTGAGLAYRPNERGNLIVWDMAKGGYRTIKLARLLSIRAHGQTVEFGEVL